jgi:hypothetical protein
MMDILQDVVTFFTSCVAISCIINLLCKPVLIVVLVKLKQGSHAN